MAGGAALRVGGQAVYKIGSAVYPTVEAALTAVLNKTPSLRMALGKLVDKLSLAGDAIARSALGRGAAKAEAALGKMEAKVGERVGLRKVVLERLLNKRQELKRALPNGNCMKSAIQAVFKAVLT